MSIMKLTTLQQPVKDRQHVLFYGGRVAELEYRGYKFILGAYGYVEGYLKDTTDGHDVCWFKDRRNEGLFGEIVSGYIDNDKQLRQALRAEGPYQVDLWDNNWWEVLIDGPDGNQYDLGWVCNSDYYEDALREMAESADEVIAELEQPVRAIAG